MEESVREQLFLITPQNRLPFLSVGYPQRTEVNVPTRYVTSKKDACIFQPHIMFEPFALGMWRWKQVVKLKMNRTYKKPKHRPYLILSRSRIHLESVEQTNRQTLSEWHIHTNIQRNAVKWQTENAERKNTEWKEEKKIC